MDYKGNSFSKLSNLNDDQLRGLIDDISSALGADKSKISAMTGDLGMVRATLSGISDEDAKKLINKAGKEKAEKIYEALNRR